MAIATAIGHT
jgi:hypothetical protein